MEIFFVILSSISDMETDFPENEQQKHVSFFRKKTKAITITVEIFCFWYLYKMLQMCLVYAGGTYMGLALYCQTTIFKNIFNQIILS